MKLVREFCDAGCGFEFKEKHGRDRMGLAITMGYSKNGWGSRMDMVNWSGEVCSSCYETLGTEVGALWNERLKKCQSDSSHHEIPKARVESISWRDYQVRRIKECLESMLRR